jgi:hypothetical protein
VEIKKLWNTWRHSIALHGTLEIKMVMPINNDVKNIVQIEAEEVNVGEKIKMRGLNHDGLEIYVVIELIGKKELIERYHFEVNKHVGIVIKTID